MLHISSDYVQDTLKTANDMHVQQTARYDSKKRKQETNRAETYNRAIFRNSEACRVQPCRQSPAPASKYSAAHVYLSRSTPDFWPPNTVPSASHEHLRRSSPSRSCHAIMHQLPARTQIPSQKTPADTHDEGFDELATAQSARYAVESADLVLGVLDADHGVVELEARDVVVGNLGTAPNGVLRQPQPPQNII